MTPPKKNYFLAIYVAGLSFFPAHLSLFILHSPVTLSAIFYFTHKLTQTHCPVVAFDKNLFLLHATAIELEVTRTLRASPSLL